MCNLMRDFWKDEGGALITTELVMIATLLVLGLFVGLVAIQQAVVCEMGDLAMSIRGLNQTVVYRGFNGCASYTAGSSFFNGPGPVCFLPSGVGMTSYNSGGGVYPTAGYCPPPVYGSAVPAQSHWDYGCEILSDCPPIDACPPVQGGPTLQPQGVPQYQPQPDFQPQPQLQPRPDHKLNPLQPSNSY